MENITISQPLFAEQLFDYVPDVKNVFKDAWIHMTENYTKFQIATYGSLLVHEVSLDTIAKSLTLCATLDLSVCVTDLQI